MPNIKQLKALKKLMQEQGLLKQVEKMATVPDKYGAVSGEAIEALRAAQNPKFADMVIKNELRNARNDIIRKDALHDMEDKLMISPDLNTRINRMGNEDRWSRMGGPKEERSLGSDQGYDVIPNAQPFQKTRELLQAPAQESSFAKQAAAHAQKEVDAGLSEEQAFLKASKKFDLSNKDYRDMVRLFGKGSSD